MVASRTLLVGGLALAAACARTEPQVGPASDAEVAAVARVLATIDSCARTGALHVFISLSADDVVMLAPDQPAVVGKDAVREYYRGFYGTFAIDMRHELIETHAVGDLVVSRGNGRGTITPKAGGQPISFDNKYVMLFRRQADGSLKVWRVAFNSNVPLAAPAAAPAR